jgi:hypothetical protein
MTREIVEPEPHSKPKFGDGWEELPRWVRVVIWLIAAAVVVLVAYITL